MCGQGGLMAVERGEICRGQTDSVLANSASESSGRTERR
jgi:hypothetical protein